MIYWTKVSPILSEIKVKKNGYFLCVQIFLIKELKVCKWNEGSPLGFFVRDWYPLTFTPVHWRPFKTYRFLGNRDTMSTMTNTTTPEDG